MCGDIGHKSFQKHTKYTVATVVSDFHYRKTSGGAGYDLIFKLKGITYKRTASTGQFIKNNRYLAAYDSLDPKSGQLLDINVTDFIYAYPKNGWKLKEIPFKVDSLDIKRQLE